MSSEEGTSSSYATATTSSDYYSTGNDENVGTSSYDSSTSGDSSSSSQNERSFESTCSSSSSGVLSSTDVSDDRGGTNYKLGVGEVNESNDVKDRKAGSKYWRYTFGYIASVVLGCGILFVIVVSVAFFKLTAVFPVRNEESGYVKTYMFRHDRIEDALEEYKTRRMRNTTLSDVAGREMMILEEIDAMCKDSSLESQKSRIATNDDFVAVYQRCSMKNAAVYIKSDVEEIYSSEVQNSFLINGDLVNQLLVDVSGIEVLCQCISKFERCDEEELDGEVGVSFEVRPGEFRGISPSEVCLEALVEEIAHKHVHYAGCRITGDCKGILLNPAEGEPV